MWEGLRRCAKKGGEEGRELEEEVQAEREVDQADSDSGRFWRSDPL